MSRRDFGLVSLAAAASLATPAWLGAATTVPKRYKYCAFVKFLRGLEYEALADAMADAGFDGVEVTARQKESYINIDRAADELPKLSETLAKRGLEITILTTDILRADEPHARPLLKAAADVGIKRYRLGFYRYDLKTPIVPQLVALEPVFQELAALNRELGISAVYQNHCGADMMGALSWDLHSLLDEVPPSEIGCVFDIRHAMVEGGEAWPAAWNIMQPHTTAISVKDFRLQGPKSEHVPLGEGQVDPKFFKLLQQSSFDGPISVHVEYAGDQGVPANVAALKRDFGTLQKWMAEAT